MAVPKSLKKAHGHHRPPHNIRYPSQENSTLLSLPGEVRMLIYRACLVRPSPIDLWPATFITDPSTHPELTERVKKAADTHTARYGNSRWHAHATPRFRHQQDLERIRKNMAIAILRTSRQVYREATHLFWSENVWRFSGDKHWIGLRRFLVTIGPRARALVKNIEILAPLSTDGWLGLMEPDDIRNGCLDVAKNHPKMRMLKTNSKDGVEFVIALLKSERMAALKELKFLLPEGWKMDKMFYLRRVPEALWQVEYAIASDTLDNYMHFPLFQKELPWLKYFLVVEEGACFLGLNYADILKEEGITVIIKKGACMTIAAGANQTVEQRLVLEAKAPIWDYLDGVQSMFEPEQMVGPGRGGKALKSTPRRTARVLKGFGGCRFVHHYGYYCMQCGAKAPDQRRNKSNQDTQAWPKKARECSMHPQGAPPGSGTYLVDGIPAWKCCSWNWLDCIAVANTKRAARQGIVEQPITGRRWML